MAFPATNEGQELNAQNDVQVVKDALSASGSRAIVSIAGSTSEVGSGVGEATTGHYRPAAGRLGVVVAGSEVGRWSAEGLQLGTMGDASTYLAVVDPYAAWTETASAGRASLRVTLGEHTPAEEARYCHGSGESAYHHGAIVGAVDVPSGSTYDTLLTDSGFKAGVIGLARNSSAGAADSFAAVGVYGEANALVAGAGTWGGNFLVADRPSLASFTALWGLEVSANVESITTRTFLLDAVYNAYVTVNTGAVDANVDYDGAGAIGLHIWTLSTKAAGVGTSYRLFAGAGIMDGAATYGVVIGCNLKYNEEALAADNTCASMPLVFRARNAASTVYTPRIFGWSDGGLIVRPGIDTAAFLFQDLAGDVDWLAIASSGVTASGLVHALQGTATTAGGARALRLGESGPDVYVGSGAPTAAAAQGSLYLRTDGSSTSTRLYVNTNGGTTWTAVTTAS